MTPVQRFVLATVSICMSLGSAQTFRVSGVAVDVDVFVGRGKQSLTGLTAADFEVLDNGVRQNVESFETRSLPVNVILALDVSHSVRGEKLEDLKSAASLLLAGLEPQDGAGLVTFSSVVRANLAFDGPLTPLLSALDAQQSFGSTSLNDGLYAALKLAEDRDHPLIVLFTDGEDRFSWLTEDQVFETARRTEAPIFVVASKYDGDRLTITTAFFHKLCRMTGGTFYETTSTEQLTEIFSSILERMKTRYVLTFYPKGNLEPGWHTLDVKLKNHRADVRARQGYYYEK